MPEVTAGPHPRPRGGRHRRGGRPRRQHASTAGDRVLVSCITLVRALPVLPRGPLRAMPRRRRLDPRPPDRRHPGRVRARAVRRQLRLHGPRRAHRRAGAVARRHPADRLRGRRPQRRVRPGDVVAVVGAGPIGLAAILDARLFSPSTSSRSTSPTAASRRPSAFGADVVGQQRHARTPSPRSCELTDGLGADVAIEAVGVPDDIRARADAGPPGRARRERRRARQAGDAAPRDALDQRRHDHDGARRHVLDAAAAAGSSPAGAWTRRCSRPTGSRSATRWTPTTSSRTRRGPAR